MLLTVLLGLVFPSEVRTRVLNFCHMWTLGATEVFTVGPIPGVVGCLKASLASAHPMPIANSTKWSKIALG